MHPKKELPGVSPQNKFAMVNGDGKEIDSHTVCFPIVKQDAEGDIHLIGTGFYISDNGLFLTAKHVLLDVIDSRGRQTAPISIFHFLPGGGYVVRPILRCVSHEVADISVGVAAPMSAPNGDPLKSLAMTLFGGDVDVGSEISTFAYPATVTVHGEKQELHFNPEYYSGNLEEHHRNGRDRYMLPGPCARTSMYIHGGASGGPVFAAGKGVYAVNSTGLGQEPISYITPIHTISNLILQDVSSPVSDAQNNVQISALAKAGFIPWKE